MQNARRIVTGLKGLAPRLFRESSLRRGALLSSARKDLRPPELGRIESELDSLAH